MPAQIGDYVLATKYDDGDPCDHFCVGFVREITSGGAYIVYDDEGRPFRANGFLRVEPITQDEGRELCRNMHEFGDRAGPSVWDRLAILRSRIAP